MVVECVWYVCGMCVACVVYVCGMLECVWHVCGMLECVWNVCGMCVVVVVGWWVGVVLAGCRPGILDLSLIRTISQRHPQTRLFYSSAAQEKCYSCGT